jgi:lipopolysaccharide/colanic/teichoic acid biosynthesis glycosyltransferase
MPNGQFKTLKARFDPLIQDTFLSCLGSFFAFLMVRWLANPIYGFSLHFLYYIGGALIFTLLGLLISGTIRQVRMGTYRFSTDRLFLTLFIKEIGITILMLTDLGGFTLPAHIVLAIISDTLFSAMLIFIIRTSLNRMREEALEMKELSFRPNTLVFGDDDNAALFAESAKQSGRYNILGLLSRNPEMDKKIIRGFLVYYIANDAALAALQWRLGGIDCILFPKGDGDDPGGSGGGGGGSIPKSSKMSPFERFTKRGFDIVLSGILLIVFLPLILICALAVFIEDGTPVIYSQERIGLGGRPFHILKFRSMRRDAESLGIPRLYSGDNDPRLTRVGKFLRQHHLDELPQLWNVFRGDMSFIGYRPERQFYIDRIMEKNPRYRYLYQIRPGVTSYATLYNGYTDTLEKMLTRLDLDLYYLRNHSVWFDFRVLGLTFLSIVSGKKF